MCGRYIIVQKVEILKKRFIINVSEDITYAPSFNVSPGQYAPVITNDKPDELQMFKWGLTPKWAKKPVYNTINARAEGDFNKENSAGYQGEMGIVDKPVYRDPIKKRRCLVLADAFYEGPAKERLSKPYLCYLRNKVRPFAFAGLWDMWIDPDGKEIYNYSIITTKPNSLMEEIGHHRSPVILEPEQEKVWLDNSTPMDRVLSMLEPYDGDLMNAYLVSDRVKSWKNNDTDLLEPLDETVFPEGLDDEFLE